MNRKLIILGLVMVLCAADPEKVTITDIKNDKTPPFIKSNDLSPTYKTRDIIIDDAICPKSLPLICTTNSTKLSLCFAEKYFESWKINNDQEFLITNPEMYSSEPESRTVKCQLAKNLLDLTVDDYFLMFFMNYPRDEPHDTEENQYQCVIVGHQNETKNTEKILYFKVAKSNNESAKKIKHKELFLNIDLPDQMQYDFISCSDTKEGIKEAKYWYENEKYKRQKIKEDASKKKAEEEIDNFFPKLSKNQDREKDTLKKNREKKNDGEDDALKEKLQKDTNEDADLKKELGKKIDDDDNKGQKERIPWYKESILRCFIICVVVLFLGGLCYYVGCQTSNEEMLQDVDDPSNHFPAATDLVLEVKDIIPDTHSPINHFPSPSDLVLEVKKSATEESIDEETSQRSLSVEHSNTSVTATDSVIEVVIQSSEFNEESKSKVISSLALSEITEETQAEETMKSESESESSEQISTKKEKMKGENSQI